MLGWLFLEILGLGSHDSHQLFLGNLGGQIPLVRDAPPLHVRQIGLEILTTHYSRYPNSREGFCQHGISPDSPARNGALVGLLAIGGL